MKLKFLFAILILTTLIFSYTVTTFNDSSSSINIIFTGAGSNESFGIILPEKSNISSATMDVSGDVAGDWTNATSGLSGYDYISDFHIFSANDIHALGYNNISNGVAGPGAGCSVACNTHYKWNGTDWYTYLNTTLYKFDFVNSTFAFGVNKTGQIYFFDGSSWTSNQIFSGTRELLDIDMYNATLGYAVGKNSSSGGILVYKWDGSTWSLVMGGAPGTSALNSVKFTDATTLWAVGQNGYIMRIVNGAPQSVLSPTSNDLNAIDSVGGKIMAVGGKGQIIQYIFGSWSNMTSPLPETVGKAGLGVYDLYDISIVDSISAYAVGKGGTIIKYNGLSWSNETSPTSKNLYSVAGVDHSFIFAGGSNNSIIRYFGYPNGVTVDIGSDAVNDWNPLKTEISYAVTTFDLSTIFNTHIASLASVYNNYKKSGTLWLAAPSPHTWPIDPDVNITIPINVSSGTSGSVQISNLNVVFGTQLIGQASGYSFNLSNGTDVTTNPIYSDSDIYIYKNNFLTAKVTTDFSRRPNYDGWTSDNGLTSNSLAYIITGPLSDAVNAQNISQKTIYLEWNNTGTSLVCLIDNALITSAALDGITKGSHCTANGGISLSPSTITAGGKTYFAIPNVENSGAVQIIREESIITFGGGGFFSIINNPPSTPASNNPPVIASSRITPSSGFVYNVFTFRAKIFDPDNDDFEFVRVYIDGVPHEMTSNDFSSSAEGREYTYETYLEFSNEHEYYFEAGDGKDTGSTVLQIGPVMYPVEDVPVPIISSASGLTIVFVIVIFLFAVILFAKRKFF